MITDYRVFVTSPGGWRMDSNQVKNALLPGVNCSRCRRCELRPDSFPQLQTFLVQEADEQPYRPRLGMGLDRNLSQLTTMIQ
jgi:hypothetical protein